MLVLIVLCMMQIKTVLCAFDGEGIGKQLEENPFVERHLRDFVSAKSKLRKQGLEVVKD